MGQLSSISCYHKILISCAFRQQHLEQERLDRELAMRLAQEDASQVENVQAAVLPRYVVTEL